MALRDEWTEDSAMQVLQHQTVDSKLWSEAVEWLLLYGQKEIREILLSSSGVATSQCFPDLQAEGYAADGQPCYRVEDLAKNLKISEDDARKLIQKKENHHETHHFIDEKDTMKVQ